jgi:DNA mismatch repair protein MutL
VLACADEKFLLIQQQAAHERVIYERLTAATEGKSIATQRSLFPATVELTPADAVLVSDLLPDLQQLGYMIEPFGKTTFIIQGTPADVVAGNEGTALEGLLEQYKHFNLELKLPKREMLLRTLAWQQAIKPGTLLLEKEIESLVNDLFTCRQPNASPSGRPTYVEFKKEQLEKMFQR